MLNEVHPANVVEAEIKRFLILGMLFFDVEEIAL